MPLALSDRMTFLLLFLNSVLWSSVPIVRTSILLSKNNTPIILNDIVISINNHMLFPNLKTKAFTEPSKHD